MVRIRFPPPASLRTLGPSAAELVSSRPPTTPNRVAGECETDQDDHRRYNRSTDNIADAADATVDLDLDDIARFHPQRPEAMEP